MIIDIHAHVTAPDSLYVYKAGLLSHRGAHGRGAVNATDEDIIKALNSPVFGGSSHLDQLKEAGTDMQIISPRPYQMMHSENPKLVDVVYRRDQQHHRPPDEAVSEGLPRRMRIAAKSRRRSKERCFRTWKNALKKQGFVGCLINPDPGEGERPPDSAAG